MTDDITQSILRGIREDLHANARQAAADREPLHQKLDAFRTESKQRFEVIEHTLKDMSEQLLFHSRAFRSLLERRPTMEDRLAVVEARVERLERKG
jgi:hypothetical protein